MEIVCPHCSARVTRQDGGTCPRCQGHIADVDFITDSIGSPSSGDTQRVQQDRCPEVAILRDYLRDRLELDEAGRVEEHVQSCPPCETALEKLSEALANGLGAATPSPAANHSEVILSDHADRVPDATVKLTPDASNPSQDAGSNDAPNSDVHRRSEGLRIGKYSVVRTLGRGGQAVTYLVFDPDLNRQVVIKQYHSSGTLVEQEAVLNEGRALARVKSSHVAKCLNVERIEKDVYLVMEFIRGENLAQRVRKDPVGFRVAVELVEQIAEGLQDVHACGVLHRDVKPANIIVGNDNRPRLVDFGLATPLASETLEQFGGTLQFMSPEQARSDAEHMDPRSDVFGLGAVFYWLLCGRPPYTAEFHREIWRQAKNAQFDSPKAINPAVPQQLDRICLKAMAPDIAKRYRSADALACALRRYLRNSDRPPSLDAPSQGLAPNPYKGLAAFTESDSHMFFGRDEQIERLWNSFRALHTDPAMQSGTPRVLPILGPSGSGKSSLARAGLIAELMRRPLPQRERVRYVVLTPGAHPLESLAAALARIATDDVTPVTKTREFEEQLRLANGDGHYDGLRRIADIMCAVDNVPFVLLVDQFEEVYSLCQQETDRRMFIDSLLHATTDPSGQVSAIFTLRSDFLGETQDDGRLNTLVSEQGLIVPAMTDAELRRAIAEPARKAGRPLEPALIDLLVHDVREHEGALPLLQFALTRIWEGIREGQRPIDTLRDLGGVGGALAGAAQSIYDDLTTEDQRIARRAFLAMVQLGEGTRDTRRRARIAVIAAAGEDSSHVRKVLSRFAERGSRLVTLSSEGGDEVSEVTHEALFDHWRTLSQWVDENRDDIRLHRRLEAAARHWDEEGRPNGLLWRSPDLDSLREFCQEHHTDLAQRESDFYVASNRRAKVDRRLKVTAIALICIGFVTSIGMWYRAVQEARKARSAEEVAALAWQDAARSAAANAAEAGTLRLLQASDQLGLLHLARAREEAENDTTARERNTLLWSGWYAALADRLFQVVGHRKSVVDLAVSPDGKLFATASVDGTAQVWHINNGQPATEKTQGLRHPSEEPIVVVRFSPDGHRLATASQDGSVRLWNVNSQFLEPTDLTEDGTSNAHTDRVLCVAFHPRQQLVATGSADGSLRLWNATTGHLIQTLQETSEKVHAIAFGPVRGDQLATLSTSEEEDARITTTLRLWSHTAGDEGWTQQDERDFPWERTDLSGLLTTPAGVAFQPNNEQEDILAVALDKMASVIKIQQRQRLEVLAQLPHNLFVWEVRFSPNGKLLATACADDTSQIWMIDSLVERGPDAGPFPFGDNKEFKVVDHKGTEDSSFGHFEIAFHEGDVQAVAISPDNRLLATASWDQTVRIWELKLNRELVALGHPLRHFGRVWRVQFTPNGKHLITVSSDGNARVWNLAPHVGQRLRHAAAVNDVVFSHDSTFIATASDDSTVQLWNTRSLRRHQPPLHHDAAVLDVAVNLNDSLIACGCEDGTAHIWRTDGTKLGMLRVADGRPVESVVFAPNGKLLATGARTSFQNGVYTGLVKLWDVGELIPIGNEIRRTYAQLDFIKAMCFSPDGSLFACANSYEVKLWNTRPFGARSQSFSHNAAVTDVIFDRHGEFLITSGWDGASRVWNVSNGQPAAPPLEHGKGVLSAALSQDGTVYATASEDKYLRVWNTNTWKIVGRPLKHVSDVVDASTSSTGQLVACRSGSHVTMWQAHTGFPIGSFHLPDLQGNATISNDGTALAATLRDNSAWIVRLPPLPDSGDEINLRTWVALGSKLSDDDQVESLGWQEWQQNRDRLNELVGVPGARTGNDVAAWHRQEAAKFDHRKDWEPTIWHLTELIKTDQKNVQHRIDRGLAFLENLQFQDASRDFDEYLRQNPKSQRAYFARGLCQQKIGNQAAAAEDLLHAFALNVPPDRSSTNEYAKLVSQLDVADSVLASVAAEHGYEAVLTRPEVQSELKCVRLVKSYYEKFVVLSSDLHEIKRDEELAPQSKTRVIELAQTKEFERPSAARDLAWSVVVDPEQSEDAYQRSLDWLERLARQSDLSEDARLFVALGGAHFRDGRYATAQQKLNRGWELGNTIERQQLAGFVLVFFAMCSAERDNIAFAEELLGDARDASNDLDTTDPDLQRLLIEAEALIERKKQEAAGESTG